jgi:hypothetical protein
MKKIEALVRPDCVNIKGEHEILIQNHVYDSSCSIDDVGTRLVKDIDQRIR